MGPDKGVPHDVTGLLARASSGDAAATAELFPVVYEELRTLAANHLAGERPNHTLQPTALVHEAYIRLVGADANGSWDNRAHFFGAAAKAIRRILIEHARARGRIKRGGGMERTTLQDVEAPTGTNVDLLDLSESMDRLAAIDQAKAHVVELRFFGGLSLEETAKVLGVSVPTVSRHWEFARAWLHKDMMRGTS
jgi:RNA polymerase sigma factor (TIGR02999 family)